jgi:hypothetical protein
MMTNPTRRFAISAVLAVLLAAGVATAQQSATPTRTEERVRTLAAEGLQGRLVGSDGERQAAEYLAAELKRIGALPLPGQRDYRLSFDFTAGSRDGGSSMSLSSHVGSGAPTGVGSGFSRTYQSSPEIQALSFSDNGEVSGPVVFAGYGLVVPDTQNFGYDSYVGIDVKDKIVVVLRYYPEDADADTKSILARYAGLRYKAMAARQRGARALIVVTGPRSPNAGQLVPMTFDTALAGSGIVAATVNGAVGASLFAGAERTLEEAQRALDSGNPHVSGFDLPGVTVTLRTNLVRERRTGFNIAGYLPATGNAAASRPWIALGAHYDHLGRGDHGNSLATAEEAGRVHYGADDNASGSAAVLAAGERLAAVLSRRRNVVLSFWSGEEIGLVGSNAYVTTPPIPIDQLAAYLNFDMVGRMQDNKLVVQAAGSSAAWPRLVEQANVLAGFDLQVQNDPYLPTDSASFNQAGVPTLNFFTGTHTDYHKPSDTADKIQFEDLDRVAAFAATIARRLMDADEAPAFVKVEQQTEGGSREGIRIFTGTVPDYATEVKGLLLGGVIGGGPAEKAGLQKGDIIVEIAGQTIANIYDYTYALEVLKVDEGVKVVYMRNGERRETTLTPTARR